MASVYVDVPGIGTIEAKNAASEATLQAILKAIKAQGGAKGGAAGAGGAANAVPAGGGKASKGLSALSGTAGKLAGSLSKVAGVAGMVYTGFVKLGEGTVSTINKLATVGDSVEAAAQAFQGIPVFGSMLSAAASATQRLTDSYLNAAKSGASFGGSINRFTAAASAAGMTVEKFGALIGRNGEGMLGFGDTVENGAVRFAKLAKNLQSTSAGLNALGFSTEEINQGLANYGKLLRIQGQQRGKSDEELARGAKNYLREMDALAKATGEERSALEAKMQQMATDAQFAAFMADKDADVQNSFNQLLTRLGPTLGNFAKDFITTGTLTSEQTQKIGAMYGQQALDELMRLRQKALANQKASAADSDRTVGIMIDQSKRIGQQFGSTMAASGGALDDVSKAMIDGQKLQRDAMTNATEEQKRAQKETDEMNKRMQDAQKTLARVSNEFTLFLANSGLLDDLMGAFNSLVEFTRTFLIPTFNAIVAVGRILYGIFDSFIIQPLMIVGRAFKMITTPGRVLVGFLEDLGVNFSGLSGTVDKFWGSIKTAQEWLTSLYEDALYALYDTIQDYVMPVFNFLGRMFSDVGNMLGNFFSPIIKTAGQWINDYLIKPVEKFGKFIYSYLEPPIKWMSEKFTAIGDAVGNWFRSFNRLSEVGEWMSIQWDELTLGFKKFALWLDEKTEVVTTDEEQAKFDKRRKEIQDQELEQQKRKEKLEERLAVNREENLKKQQAEEAKRDKERAERDRKRHLERKAEDKDVADHKKSLDAKAADESKKLDYNDSLSLLKATYDSPVAKAEATRGAMVTAAEQKAAAEAKNATEAKEASASAPSTTATSASPIATQESPESLLSSLNTKMDQLVKYMAQTTTNTYQNVQATNALSGDLLKAI